MLDNVRIVLVETSHPGNIGAAARAMKNMGLSRLALVKPHFFPHAKATARASGATGVLADAQVYDSLAQALAGCTHVYGASARSRTIAWPQVSPRECAAAIASSGENTSTAIVFGRERTGLSNEELDQCQKMLHIPCNPDFSSLNVAAAVQVVSYELYGAVQAAAECYSTRTSEEGGDARPSTQQEMAQFYEHLERTIIATDFFDPENPRQLRRRLRRLFNRAEPDKVELNILRGILTSVEKNIAGE